MHFGQNPGWNVIAGAEDDVGIFDLPSIEAMMAALAEKTTAEVEKLMLSFVECKSFVDTFGFYDIHRL